MAAKKNILDVYRDFRKKDPSVCYAFGDAEFFTFYMTDAHRVHNALPDLQIEHERCDFLRIHKLAFFPTAVSTGNLLSFNFYSTTYGKEWTPGAVPEPSSAMLLLLGFAGLALKRRRA